MSSVTVLTPKGRRQQVKVTPNTTLLQVLEEVCTKHGFNPEEYDLRHHNKVLDISSMFRFTSLPNNAVLQMTETTKQRIESPVTLGLQLESGERLTGVFIPSDSIWQIIITLKPEEEKSTNPVVIYMRQEICGKENLKLTTLKSLGLTGGRAMLRLLHKSPEELHTQANVTTNLTRISIPLEKENKESSKSPKLTKKEISGEQMSMPTQESIKKETRTPKIPKDDSFNSKENLFHRILKEEKTRKAQAEGQRKSTASPGSSIGKKEFADEIKAVKNVSDSPLSNISAKGAKDSKGESKVILLGERSAVAYNLNSVKPMVFEEEPDDFYELTITDAKMLLKQAQQLCADLEDAPLMTSAQRELEKDKKVLSLLHQYKKTVLRVKFPDRTVLQGTFSPLETISAVEKFVAGYIYDPNLKFYLYTTPPKLILKSDERLIECGCVPSCVLYFGMISEVSPPTHYLKREVLEKLSTPSAAALTAIESRGLDRKLPAEKLEEAEKRKWTKNSNNASEPGTSGGETQWEDGQKEEQGNSPQFKVPKWFRANK